MAAKKMTLGGRSRGIIWQLSLCESNAMKRWMTVMLVSTATTVVAAPQTEQSPSEATKCMSTILQAAPGARDVGVTLLDGRDGIVAEIQYSFTDKSGDLQTIRFPLVRDPIDQSLVYNLSQAHAYEGPITHEVVEEWIVTCSVGGGLVT